jgi:hypothetical protein
VLSCARGCCSPAFVSIVLVHPDDALVKSSTGTPTGSLAVSRSRDEVPIARFEGRNRTKADIFIYAHGNGRIVIKDYGPRPAWIRHTVGRVLIRREAAAYRAAEGLSGVPRCFGRVGRFALALEWIDGAPLADQPPESVSPALFDSLADILSALHDRGVALTDLHHRDVLVGANDSVYVIDLASAWLPGKGGWLRRSLFDRLRQLDRIALERMRARFTGGDPDAAVDAAGVRAANWYRRGRRLKNVWNMLRRRQRRADRGR